MADYTKEQFWKIYKELPEELKDSMSSIETTDSIYDICVGNGLEQEEASEVVRYTGRVLLGLLPPEEFQKALEKKLKLKKDAAKKIAQEINRLVFLPVKRSLTSLYKTGVAPEQESSLEEPLKTIPSVTPSEEAIAPEEEPKEKEPEKEDIYREPIK